MSGGLWILAFYQNFCILLAFHNFVVCVDFGLFIVCFADSGLPSSYLA